MNYRFVARTIGTLALLALASCFGDGTGPGEMRKAQLIIAPVFDRQALHQVDVNRVLVRFTRVTDGSKAFEQVVDFPATSDTLDLSVAVPVQNGSEDFDLTILMIDDPAADTVFRSGPTRVTATVGTTPVTVPVPPFVYVGTGANAVGVRWVTTPAQVYFGQTVTFVAEAYDAANATIPNTPISWSSSDPLKANVPDDAVGNVVGGSARGSVSVTASLLLTSTQSAPPSISVPLVVQPVANAVLLQGGSGQTGTVGTTLSQPLAVRVNAADNQGVQGVTVNFAVVTGGGSVTPASALTNASGDASASWTLGPTIGTQSVSATVAGVTGGTVTVGAIGVVGAASKLAFTVAPSAVGIGAPITPPVQVTAQDAFGNTVTTYTGNIAIAIGANPGGATLSGITTAAAVGGVATFSSLALSAGGNGYTLIASATGLTSATSAAFNVIGGVPTQVAFVVQPTATSAGATITPPVQVAIRDAVGALMTSATNTVTIAIASNPGGGTLTGTVSVAAVGGIATFNSLSINAPGTGYTLSAASAGLTGATSAAFDIIAGTPQSLQFTTPPAGATAGSGFAPSIVVTAKDAGGNTATSFTGAVTLAIGTNPGGASLGGTTTVNAVAGVATFPGITITTAATGYTLTASATGLTSATSAAFGIAPAAASVLTFTQQPITTAAGATLAPAVEVTAFDAFGNVATGFAGNVTVGIGNNPGGATLVGTTTMAAVAGVATYTNLTLTTKGASYTLTASSGALGSAVSQAFDMTALTLAWSNPAGGNWSNASNWSLGRVPLTTDSVVIALPGTYTVTLDTTFSASFLTVGGATGTQTLSLTSRTLTVSGSMTILASGVFATDNSTVAGVGTVVNQGTLTPRATTFSFATTLDNQGTIITNGSVFLNGPFTTAAGSVLRIQPDGTTGFSNVIVGVNFTNNGAIDLTSTGGAFSAALSVGGAFTLTNAAGGTITTLVGTGGSRSVGARLDNQGTVTVLQPLTTSLAGVTYQNSGTIDVSGADWTLALGSGALTNTGTITIAAGRTWFVNGGILNQNAGTIGGPGTLSLTTMTANFTTNFSNATTGLALDNSTWNGPGTLTNVAGQTLTLRNVTIGATSALDNQGTLITNATVTVAGPLTTTAASVLRLQPDGTTGFSNFTSALGFTNNGTIELTSVAGAFSATLFVTGPNTLTNAAGATIASLVGAGGSRTITAQLNNLGTVTLLQPLTLNQTSAAHSNVGLFDATAADFTLNMGGTTPSFTNTGTVTIGAGRTWFVNNGTLNQAAGTIGGPGTLSLTTVTANFTTNFSNATTGLALDNSTWNGPGTLTNVAGQTLTLRNVTIGATSALDNQGTLITNATVTVAGPLTTTAASVLRLQPDGTTGFSNFTSSLGFTNNGTIELTSVAGAFSATLLVTGANTLTNAAGATILSAAGNGGARTIDAQLANLGTVTLLQPLTLSHASAAHTNNGLIDATAENFTLSMGGTTPSFTNTGTVTIGSGRIWFVNNGTLNQNAGSIGGPGTLSLTTVTANFTTNFSNATTGLALDNSTWNGPGTLTNAAGQTMSLRNVTIGATSVLDNQGTLVTNATVTVAGPLTTSAGSVLRLQPDGSTGFSNFTSALSFTNNGLIELTSVAGAFSATLFVTGPNTLTNAAGATIASLVGAGGPRTITAQLNNLGTVTLLQPLTLNQGSAAHSNSGLIDATAADLTINQGGTTPSFTNISTGILTVGAGRTLTVNGGALTQAGTLNGGGTLTLNTVTTAFSNPFTLGTLNINGGSATLTASLSTAALALNFDGTTINGPGTITNAPGQTMTLKQTTIAATSALDNQGTLITNATVTVAGPLTTSAGSVLRLQPDGSTGFSNFTSALSFTNNGLIELTSVAGAFSATLFVTGPNTLTNAAGATISTLVGAGGARTITAQLNNLGTVTLLQPLTLNQGSAAHSNSGLIDATAADLTISQGGTTPSFTNISTGILTVGAGRTLTVNGGALTQAGTLNGGGTLTLNTVTTTFANPFTLGTLNINGGSATLTPSLSTAALALNFDGTTINGPGTITNAPGQTMTLKQTTIAATSALDNQGTLITNATVTVAGPFTTAPASVLRLQPDGTTGFSNFTSALSFTNNGAIELTSVGGGFSTTLFVTGPNTLTNAAGATISTLVGAGGPRTITAELNNQGTVTVLQPLTLNQGSAAHSNSGLIDATAADLTISQGGTTPSFTNISTGILTIGAGRTLTVNGGALTQAGTLNGGGTLTLNTVTTTFGNPFTLGVLNVNGGSATLTASLSTAALALNFDGTTINGPGTITNAPGQTMTLKQTTIAATSALDNQGTLITNATVTVAGPLTTSAGSVLRLQPDGTTGFSNFTSALSFTNNGAIELTSVGGGFSTTLFVTGPNTLTNAAGATISSLVGAGGPRTITAELNNQGTVTVLQPLTLNQGSAAHSNSGLIDASAADLTISQGGTTPSFTNISTGILTVGAGRTLTVNGGALTQAGTLNGGGTLTLNTVTTAFSNPFTLGVLNVNGGSATLTPSLSTAALALNFDGTTINGPGTITNAPGQTLNVRQTGFATDVINQGTLVANGTTQFATTFTAAPGSLLRLLPDGSTGFSNVSILSNGFTNDGAIELSSSGGAFSSQLIATVGTLVNSPTGTITTLVGNGGTRTIQAQLDNQGLITLNQPLTVTRNAADHTNSGTITAQASLDINQSGTTPSFINTGTVTIAAGQTWTINSGAFTQQTGATLNGGGILTLNSLIGADFNTNVTLGALNANSTNPMNLGAGVVLSTATTALSFFSSLVNGPGTITNAVGQTLTLTGTNITASSALDNQGTLLVNGGSQVNGPLTTSAGSTIRVQPDGSTGFATLSVPNVGFVNNGAVELTSLCNCTSQIAPNSGGTMTNGAGGTITTLPGSGGQRLVGGGGLINLGTITVHPGPSSSGVLQFLGNFSSSGTLNMELGGLAAGTGFSQIAVNGTAVLGGTLNFALVSFTPGTGNTFDILTSTGLSGTLTLGTQPGGWSPATYPGATAVRLTAP